MIGDDGGTSKKVKPFPPILLNIYIENNRTSSHFWRKSGRICIITIIDSKMYRDVYIPAYDMSNTYLPYKGTRISRNPSGSPETECMILLCHL